MTFGDHHPSLWLKEHPYIPAPKKVASSRDRRTTPIDASSAKKKKKAAKTKKKAAPSSVSPAKTPKKKKIVVAKTGTTKGVVIQESMVQGPPSVGEGVPQGVSTPVSKRQARKTKAVKKTSTVPLFSSLAASATARRVARDIVYIERRFKQRADALHHIPLESLLRAFEGHAAAETITSAVRAVEIEVIAITSSGGITQGNPSKSDSRIDSILSSGIASPPAVIAAVVFATTTVQEEVATLTAAEETPGDGEVPVHISDILEGQKLLLVKGKKIYLPGSDILVMEGTFAQDSAEDISMEDMADTHDSYDAVLAGNEGHRVETQVADLEVAAFATTHMSQTKIAHNGNEVAAEEERRHKTAAMEFATTGQPGASSFTRLSSMAFGCHEAESDFYKLCGGVQELTREGFKLNFILDYLWRLAHDMFSRKILDKLMAVEARAVALRNSLSVVAPDPWHLVSARGVSAESCAESALYGLLV
uniref:Uncharacterized protein n=1 Tax=Fagus sylvatica TaxID=28930 RepID=A0A2N9J6L3_FAGSY